MTSNEQSGTITILDREFDTKLLEQAMSKATDTYIEPGKPIRVIEFSCPLMPEWQEKFKKAVLTIHEGNYLVLVMKASDLADFTELKGSSKDVKRTVIKGFKAKFVTKYNFNQAKFVPPAPPVVHEVPAPRPFYPKREFSTNRPQGQRNQSSGNWNGQTRSYGNRGN